MVKFKYNIIILFLKASLVASRYKTIYIEDLCSTNRMSVLSLGSGSSNSSGILKTSRNNSFLPNKNCTISILPPLGYGVVLSIRFLDFRPYSSECKNYVQIHDMKSTVKLCGYSDDITEYQSYASEGKGLEMDFFTGDTAKTRCYSDITFIVSAYVSVDYNCERKMFPCLNGRCIWKGLTCDGHNNCGDRTDEFSNRSNCGKMPPGAVAGIVVGSLIILLLVIVLPFVCWRSRSRNDSTPPLLESEPDSQCSINADVQPQTSSSVYQDLPPAYKP